MSDDITTVLTVDDIAQVLSKADIKLELEQGLDFGNALLYHLEEALENHFSIVTECQCLQSLQVADVRRGYCTNCFGAITVRISGKAIG